MMALTKYIAGAFIVAATMTTTPVMAFGLGGMARNMNASVQSEIVVAKTGSIRRNEDSSFCKGIIGTCGGKSTYFSQSIVTYLNVKAREIEAVRNAFQAAQRGERRFSPIWNVVIPFQNPVSETSASPFMIQQIWL